MINDCTPREQRRKRRQWCKAQKVHRSKTRSQKAAAHEKIKDNEAQTNIKIQKKKRKRSKVQIKVKDLEIKLKQQVKLTWNYKKRLQRLETSKTSPK